jgi:hypothetical protein
MKRLHWSAWVVLAFMLVALFVIMLRREETPIRSDPFKTEPVARDYSKLPDHMLVRQNVAPFQVILDKHTDANDSVWYRLPAQYRVVDVSETR